MKYINKLKCWLHGRHKFFQCTFDGQYYDTAFDFSDEFLDIRTFGMNHCGVCGKKSDFNIKNDGETIVTGPE